MNHNQVKALCLEYGYSLVDAVTDFENYSVILYLEKLKGDFKEGDIFRSLEEVFWMWRFYIIMSNNFGEE